MICQFCGSSDPLTLEHAWPDWAIAYVRQGSDGHHMITSERYGQIHAQWKGPAPEITVRILCDTCNTKRLGGIEAEAAPILKRLIIARKRMLVLRPQVALIALWTVKTAMVFEFTAGSEREPFYTPEQRKALAMERRVPDKTTVLLARYVGPQRLMFDYARDLVLNPIDGGDSYDAFVSTVSIGQFVCQAISHRAPMRESAQMLRTGSHVAKQIWPTVPNLYWPPGFYLDDEALDAFARGGDSTPDQGRPNTPPQTGSSSGNSV